MEKFKAFIPVDIIEKGEKGKDGLPEKLLIAGVASSMKSGKKDKDGHRLNVEGFDYQPFLKAGFFNLEHKGREDYTNIVGEPTNAYVKDGEFHVEGQLYKDNPKAVGIYQLGQILKKSGSTRKIGYSIEGQVAEKNPLDPSDIRRSVITGVALTISPKCDGTEALFKGGEVIEYETQSDSEFLIDITDENGTRWTVDRNLTLEKAEVSEELEKGGAGSGKYDHKKGHLVHIDEKHLKGEYSYKKGKPNEIHEIKGDKAIFLTASKPLEVPLKDLKKHEGEWLNYHKDSTGTVIVDSRFENGNKIYQAAFDYLKEKGKYSDGGNITVKYQDGKFKIKGENGSATVTREELQKYGKRDLEKAMEAGSITGTETHNQSLTQQPLKVESLAGTEGKKKKRDYKKLLANLRKRRGEDSDGVIKDLSKGEIIEALVEEGLDQESAERVFELSEAIEKAEGSRGGKVIGHTKSGKPIYSKFHSSMNEWSEQDHLDAAGLYDKEMSTIGHGTKGGALGRKYKSHEEKRKFHYEASKLAKKTQGQLDSLKKISKAEIFTTLLSDHNLDIESAKNVYMLAEAIEKKSK